MHVLSGGEKARLALAKFMLTRGSLLVLDEPTNHLDIPSKETLEEALRGFQGSVIAVSHDRYFLRQIATRIITVRFCVSAFLVPWTIYGPSALNSTDLVASHDRYLLCQIATRMIAVRYLLYISPCPLQTQRVPCRPCRIVVRIFLS